MKEQILQPELVYPARNLIQKVLDELNRLLLGREHLHTMVLTGILSKGHILLEGLPGLGKTALIKALGQILKLQFKRVQFTPDMMPGDILGSSILQQTFEGKREIIFQEGPVFTNILLADEINRASPKVQSALLEAMQERCVTLGGVTRPLPSPFFVLASQNPIELEGTFPLPEAQLDRFLFKLPVGDLDWKTMSRIIQERRHGDLPSLQFQLEERQLKEIFSVVDKIDISEAVCHYIARLVNATHPESEEAPEKVKKYLSYGASPRAAIAIAESARAHSLIAGKPSVGFEDVERVAPYVLNHRIILNYQAKSDKISPFPIIEELLKQVSFIGWKHPNVSLGEVKKDEQK